MDGPFLPVVKAGLKLVTHRLPISCATNTDIYLVEMKSNKMLPNIFILMTRNAYMSMLGSRKGFLIGWMALDDVTVWLCSNLWQIVGNCDAFSVYMTFTMHAQWVSCSPLHDMSVCSFLTSATDVIRISNWFLFVHLVKMSYLPLWRNTWP